MKPLLHVISPFIFCLSLYCCCRVKVQNTIKDECRKHVEVLWLYLKDVCFENVMSQFHSLLAIQFPLLTGKHEGHEGMASPGLGNKRENSAVKQNRIKNFTFVACFYNTVSFAPE